MIRARNVRTLNLASRSGPTRARHLSAASGLVVAGDFIYVIADDEHHLGCFPAEGDREGTLMRLFPGDLPDSRKARKAKKPDLEVLTRLPPLPGYPHGALLALPSGSRPERHTGVVLAFDASGTLAGTPHLVDLAGIYAPLAPRFACLNIEGAAIVDDDFLLLQRGNQADPLNAVIRLPLPALLQAITTGESIAVDGFTVQSVDLGRVDGVPLGFTDCAGVPGGRLVFTAVAENTDDSYEDGSCAAAAVGILERNGRVQRLERLEPTQKVEGVHAWLAGDAIKVLLVTDADDETVPGSLLSAEFSREAD